MIKLSLVDIHNRPYELPPMGNSLRVRYSVITAPNRFAELFNFHGILHEKSTEMAAIPLQSFLERWAGVPVYKNDPFAPTAGNVREVIERVQNLNKLFVDGTWVVSNAEDINPEIESTALPCLSALGI